jgi:hypothetical protein
MSCNILYWQSRDRQITLSLKIHQPTGEIPVFHRECHTIGICHLLPTSSLKLNELGFSIGRKKNTQSEISCWNIHKFLSPWQCLEDLYPLESRCKWVIAANHCNQIECKSTKMPALWYLSLNSQHVLVTKSRNHLSTRSNDPKTIEAY